MLPDFTLYRLAFMDIWRQCMAAGYTTVDARNYAALELQSWNNESELRKNAAQKETGSQGVRSPT